MEKILSLLNEFAKSYGIHTQLYGEDMPDLEHYDGGLRSRLFPGFKADHLAESLRAIMPRLVHITRDAYRCCYCFFRIPQTISLTDHYCIIGPWLDEKPDDSDVEALMTQYTIPRHLKTELVQYFNSVTLITSPHSWRNALYAFIDYLHENPQIGYLTYYEIDVSHPEGEYSPEPETGFAMQKIAEHYTIENSMLDAISRGDGKDAFQYFARHREYRENQRTNDELRYWKDYNIALNTLSRKAAEQGYVHPLHINTVSAEFIRRIEAASGIAELNRLSEHILHHYCRLVREFSLKGYSPVVRNIINFIDFNLKEPLSLKPLAKQFSINASYLSALFKREKGVTITDYINSKRIQHAASLLHSTGLFIQDVAEQCGFLDFNYFTRLFKRYYGQSPREFRTNFKEPILKG